MEPHQLLSGSGRCKKTDSPLMRIVPALLLVVHAAVLLHAAPHQAPIVDEVWHLPAGISYWDRGEFWCYHHNPPLMRWLYSLPAVIAEADVDYGRYIYRPRSRQADFEFGRDFMVVNKDHYLFLFAICRPVVIAISVACGWLVWRWSRSIYGPVGGIVSLWLWVFLPESLTHSMFLTTDIGATFFGFLATWLFWRYLRTPSLRGAVYSGIALGLAQGTKYSCLILPAGWVILAGVRCLPRFRVPDRLSSPRTFCLDAFLVLFASVLTLNNLYLFDGFGRPLGDFPFYSRTLTREADDGVLENRFEGSWIGQIPLPFPEQYILGFDAQLSDVDHGGFQKYLGGTMKTGDGWWYYYLYAASVKLPLGTLAAIALILVSIPYQCLRQRGTQKEGCSTGGADLAMPSSTATNPWGLMQVIDLFKIGGARRRPGVLDEDVPMTRSQGVVEDEKTPTSQIEKLDRPEMLPDALRHVPLDQLTLLVPAMLYLVAVSSNTGLQYFRYLLPSFPFVFVLCGRLGQFLTCHCRWYRVPVWLMLLSIPVSVLRYHPYYLPYINEAAGGAAAGPRYLGDSSVDWGEGLLALRDWMRANRPGEPLRLAYFGTIAPEVVGLEHVDLPPFGPGINGEYSSSGPGEIVGPIPGLQAVSVSYLQGLSFPTPNKNVRDVVPIPAGAYRYYEHFEPIAKPAFSIWVFDLSLEDVNRVRVEMGLPVWRDDESFTASSSH